MIDIVVADATAHDNLAIRRSLNRGARQADIVIDHDGIGVVNRANQFVLAATVQGHFRGKVAQNSPFLLKIVRDEIRNDNFCLSRNHWAFSPSSPRSCSALARWSSIAARAISGSPWRTASRILLCPSAAHSAPVRPKVLKRESFSK
jgi:hypothetical protein